MIIDACNQKISKSDSSFTFDTNWYQFVESILNDKNLEACVD